MKHFNLKFVRIFFIHLFFGMSLLLVSQGMLAQKTSVKDGAWTDPATWGTASIPNTTEAVTIAHAVTFTPTANTSIGSLSIASGASLTITGTFSRTIGNLTVAATGSLSSTGTGATSLGAQTTPWVNNGSITISTLGLSTVSTRTVDNNGLFTVQSGVGSTSSGIFNNNVGATFTHTGTIAGTINNFGTMNASSLTGTAAVANITNKSTGVVNFTGSAMTAAYLVLNVSEAGNTVNYSLAGAQTIKDLAYSNLVLSGSGTKTWPQTADRTVSGNLTINSGVTLRVSSASISSVTIPGGNGGTLYTAAPTATFTAAPSGYVTATGTAILTGGVVTSVVITNPGSGYISAPTVTFSGGTTTGASASTGTTTLTAQPTAYKFTVNGSTTNNGTLNFDAFAGTGDKTFATFNNPGTITSSVGANFIFATADYSGGSQTILSGTYNNLTLSGSGTKTIGTAASGTLCTGTLTVSGSAIANVTNTNVAVDKLVIAGVGQSISTYGSMGSTAAIKDNTYFLSTSTGTIIVATGDCNLTTPTISAESATTFCNGGSVTLRSSANSGNQWYKDGEIIFGATSTTYDATTTGTYTVITTFVGCSSAASSGTTVTVNALTTTGTVTTSICAGDTYIWPANGQSYTTVQSGTTFVSGCNTATLNLTITPRTTTGSVSTSICAGDTYIWPANGQSYTTAQSGTTFVSGCNTATLNLTITPRTTTGSVTTSICAGDTYIWPANGQSYTTAQSGTTFVSGCNTATLNLTITPRTTTGSVTTSICAGDTYVWPANGQSYTTAQSGTTFVSGCNTATLNLTITPRTTTGSVTTSICAGNTYVWPANGQSYTTAQSGTTFVSGCNTATLNLTITPRTTTGTVTTSICAGETYVWPANGQSYTTAQSGTTFVSGCNTATLNLTITPRTTTGSVTTSICAGETYVWPANGQSYTTAQSGTTFVSGCNTATLNLTITPRTTTGTVTTSICAGDTYVWPANGQSYTTAQSGTTFVSGCNTATLNLTITPLTTTGSVTTSICAGDTYVWPANGQSYTTAQSGTTFVSGCNTATLNLTITPRTTAGSVTTSICAGDTYIWPANGQSYTTAQSGTTFVSGCNTATLNLTITPRTTTGTVTTSICAGDTYVWPANGQSYTTAQSGTTFVSGCNTATLNLTITPATTIGSVTTSICAGETYVWPANGQSYTTAQSGTTFVSGCNTATLNLTITPLTTNGSVTRSQVEGSYTWPVNNVTYTSTTTETVVSGCNTATLNLTILPHIPGDDDDGGILDGSDYPIITQLTIEGTTVISQSCGGSSIVITGRNFTGATAVKVNGVDVASFVVNNSNSITAVLPAGSLSGLVTVTTPIGSGSSAASFTVSANTSSTQTVIACDSYTWSVNNQAYTQSGTYVLTGTNAAGCVDTKTLVLTVTPSTTTGSVTQSQVGGSYTWPANGVTYANSTIQTIVSGCNTATLNLTITPITVTTWNGTAWSYGAPTASLEAIIAGNYSTTTNGALTAKKLTVNSGVLTVNSGNVTVVNELINNAGATAVVFENNANLIQTGTAANTGAITVKRNSSALLLLDYTLWSSPVAGQNLLAFSPSTVVGRFYNYNTATNLYNALPNPAATNFEVGSGYLIRMPSTASPTTPEVYPGVFTGVPNNGDIPVALANNGVGMRFNAIGNPYPSPISMTQFVSDNSANITGSLYFWRKTNADLGDAYCTWNNGTFVSNGQAQVFNPNGIIQTGQGFIVEAKDSATSLTFNNGQRVPNTAGQFFKTKQVVENNRIWLNATNDKNEFSQMAINYTTGANQGVDEFDAKYFSDAKTALNSVLDNTEYVIQGRALPFDVTDEVPLSFKATIAGTYSIAIDRVDGLFTSNLDIILKDNLMGTQTNLNSGPYSFTADAGVVSTRFVLRYQNTSSTVDSEFTEDNVFVNTKNGIIHINVDRTTMSKVQLYDASGRLLFKKEDINNAATTIDCSRFAKQVLIVKITSANNKEVTKKVVN